MRESKPRQGIGRVTGAPAIAALALAVFIVVATVLVTALRADAHCDVTVEDAEGLRAAIGGDAVTICLSLGGTFDLGTTTLNIDRGGITIDGQGATIDARDVIFVGDGTGFGVLWTADDVTVQNLTLLGPTADAGSAYGFKIEAADESTVPVTGVRITNVTVEGSGRSEIDLHFVDDVVLTGVDVNGLGTKGVGIGMISTTNIVLDGLTTSGNAWGAIGVFTDASEFYVGAPSVANLTITGLDAAEDNKLYGQGDNGGGIAGLNAPQFTHTVRNPLHRTQGDSDEFTYYQQSEDAAIAYALTLQTDPSYVENTASTISDAESNFVVADGLSIQVAVDAAAPGDTISVAAGTYDELVTINKSVSLLGANASVNPNTGARGPESTFAGSGAIRLIASASDVVIDGFEFTETDGVVGYGLTAILLPTGEAGGNIAPFNHFENVSIQNNRFHNLSGRAVFKDCFASFTGLTINDNRIEDVGIGGERTGIHIQSRCEAGTPSTGLTISGNEIDTTTYAGIIVDGVVGVTIENNTITNVPEHGINLGSGGGGSGDVTISGNHISFAALPSSSAALRIKSGTYSGFVRVLDNDFVDSRLGLLVQSGMSATDGVEVSGNAFATNVTQVDDNGGGLNLDDVLIGNTFDRAVVVRDNPIAVPVIFSSIQEAVDAAGDGQTVDVAVGTYAESVGIGTSNITLQGAGPGSTTIAPVDGHAVAINAHTEGRIDGVTVRGFTLQPGPGAIAFVALSGTVVAAPDTMNLTLEDIQIDGADFGIVLNAVDRASLTNVTLSGIDSSPAGALELTGVSNLGVADSTFSGNGIAIRLQSTEGLPADAYGDNGPISVSNSRFSGNVTAIENGDNAITVIARNNWWGHPSGPLHVSNPGGVGDAVSNGVEFAMWCLDLECAEIAPVPPITVCADGCDYTTIQAAIDAAFPGDTIQVVAGTYGEQVDIAKAVTLQGAGDAASGGTVISVAGHVPAITISASGVTLSGLRIEKGDAADKDDGWGIEVTGTVGDITITGVTVTGATNGLRVGSAATIDGLTVSDSHFDGNEIGWYLAKETAASASAAVINVLVTDSTFNDNLRKGIYAEKLSNATFDSIEVHNSGVATDDNFNNGIDINLKWSSYSNLTIENSSFVGSGRFVAPHSTGQDLSGALVIKARDDGTYSGSPASLTGVTVQNNTFTASSSADELVGLRLGESSQNNAGPTAVTITGNTFSGYETPFRNTAVAPVDASGLLANTFIGGGALLDRDGGLEVFPTIQAAIDESVADDVIHVFPGAYNESLAIGKSLTLRGDPGVATTAGPGENAPVLDGEGTAASAIVLAVGVSNVTIEGFVIRGYVNPVDTVATGSGVVAWNTGSNDVIVRHNRMENLGWNGVLAGSDDGSLISGWTVEYNVIQSAGNAGIELTNATDSTVRRNVVTVSDGNWNAGDSGVGIEIAARAHSTQNVVAGTGVTASNNTITGGGSGSRAGINLLARAHDSGATATLDRVTATKNTVTGLTPRGVYVVAEERAGGDAAITAVQVTANTVTGTVGTGVAVGLDSASEHVDGSYGIFVTGNTLTGGTVGLAVLEGVAVTSKMAAQFNILSSNTGFGISNAGTGVLKATNNNWGCAAGPGSDGCSNVLDNNSVDWGQEASTPPPAAPVTDVVVEEVPRGSTVTLTVEAEEEDEEEEAPSMSIQYNSADEAAPPVQITAAKYESNPAPTKSGVLKTTEQYFDINLSVPDEGVVPEDATLTVTMANTGAAPNAPLYWHDGTEWLLAVDVGGTVRADADGTYSLTVSNSTSPSIADLSGTYFTPGEVGLGAVVSDTNVEVDDTFTVQVVAQGAGLWSVDFTLEFPAGVVQVVDIDLPSVSGDTGMNASAGVTEDVDNTSGSVHIAYSQGGDDQAASGNDITLATITFSGAAAGTGDLVFTAAEFRDDGGLTLADLADMEVLYLYAAEEELGSPHISVTAPPVDPTPTPTPSGGGTQPTRTPTPPPTLTIVPDDEVVAVPSNGGAAAIVQPDQAVTLSLPEANVELTFPTLARHATFQARITQDGDDCIGLRVAGQTVRCVSVDLFDENGELLEDTSLERRATLSVTLTAEEIEELGDIGRLYNEFQAGNVSFYRYGGTDWVPVSTSFDPVTRRFSAQAGRFSAYVLHVGEFQVLPPSPTPTPVPSTTAVPTPTVIPTPVGVTPTVSPSPTPVDATPTAEATTAPIASPTPEAEPDPGDDGVVVPWVLILVVLGAVTSVGAGLIVFRRRG